MSGVVQRRAGAAALRVTGGGNVLFVARDSAEGAAYAVDVREPSDQVAEVRLDRNFRTLGVATLQPARTLVATAATAATRLRRAAAPGVICQLA